MNTQLAAVIIVAFVCVAVVLSKWLSEIYAFRNHEREGWKIRLLESRVGTLETAPSTKGEGE
jgi:hypothetical protein